MARIIDNTRKTTEFKNLIDGDFFMSLGELYIKTEVTAGWFNSLRISDGTPKKTPAEASVEPVDVEITVNSKR